MDVVAGVEGWSVIGRRGRRTSAFVGCSRAVLELWADGKEEEGGCRVGNPYHRGEGQTFGRVLVLATRMGA